MKLVAKDNVAPIEAAKELKKFFKNAFSTLDINKNFLIIIYNFQYIVDPNDRSKEMIVQALSLSNIKWTIKRNFHFKKFLNALS